MVNRPSNPGKAGTMQGPQNPEKINDILGDLVAAGKEALQPAKHPDLLVYHPSSSLEGPLEVDTSVSLQARGSSCHPRCSLRSATYRELVSALKAYLADLGLPNPSLCLLLSPTSLLLRPLRPNTHKRLWAANRGSCHPNTGLVKELRETYLGGHFCVLSQFTIFVVVFIRPLQKIS